MSNKKITPDLFVKIHGSQQVGKDKIALDIEVITVDEKGGMAGNPSI
jgi:hypothetical protein